MLSSSKSRHFNSMINLYLFGFLLIFIHQSLGDEPILAAKDDACNHCRNVVEAFNEGLLKTERMHFGGGNTDWEERKLGKFKTSHTRFDEVIDYVFHKSYGIKDVQFKCQALAEENEDVLKDWYLNFQEEETNLYKWLCIDKLEKCCLKGYYGPNCAKCPGLLAPETDSSDDNGNKRECFGRGFCRGSGTRRGTGECVCNTGYVGKMCSNCNTHYFPVVQNTTYIECAECFDGCASGCTAAGPKGCRACRTGYVMDEEVGCKDIDECAIEGDGKKCTKVNEECINTAGSYNCSCVSGYKRNSNTEECELDVEASPTHYLMAPDAILRLFAISGLFGICCFVLLYHRSPLAIGLTVVGVAAAAIIENYYELIIPAAAKKIFQ